MRMQSRLIIMGVALLIGIGALLSLMNLGEGAEWKPPQAITIVSVDVGSAKYHAAVALTSTIMKTSGVKIRVRPESKGMGRITLLREGSVDFDFTSAPGNYFKAYGKETYDVDGWGPQRLRTIWIVSPLVYGYMVRGDSDIKTWADVNGKRVPDFGLYVDLNYYMRAGLDTFGAGGKYIKIPISGYKESQEAILDGALDMTYSVPLSPGARQMEASRHGIRWLPTPHADKENWKKMQAIAPFIVPVVATEGAGLSKERPLETWGQADRFFCYDWQDSNLVYFITKQVDKAIPISRNLHPSIKDWSREYAVNLNFAYSPYHPGAIKYFKEIGIWGAKEDKWQEEQIAKEDKRIQEWKAKHPGWKYIIKGK